MSSKNLYLLLEDRERLDKQTTLFADYIRTHASEFINHPVSRVLDIGCGEGQLTRLFAELYPAAEVIGVDIDESAIRTARQRYQDIPNLSFKAVNIQEELATGSFDLIYASMVFVHLSETEKTAKMIFNALNPGGCLWTKEVAPNIGMALLHPAYLKLMKWMGSALQQVRATPNASVQLPAILQKLDFKQTGLYQEIYPMGGGSEEELALLFVMIDSVLNAKKLISEVLNISENEIETAHEEVRTAALGNPNFRGSFIAINSIFQKPA